MSKFFVYFGKSHEHQIGSMQFDHTKALEVNAPSISDAEQIANKMFDKKYAMIVNEKQHFPELFPGGIEAKITF